MRTYGFIYMTTNILNGMRYIGQTYWRPRMDPTYFGSGKAIKRAIAKNGLSAFTRETLFEAFTKDDLDWAERHFIAEHGAVASRSYYNITPGGRASMGFSGKKHSAEHNAAMSARMLSQHPRGIAITIDGHTYISLSQAGKATGYSRLKLERFLKTGVHPLQQVHGGRGQPKTCVNPRAKTWCLLGPDGEITVTSLKPWCRERGMNADMLHRLKNTDQLHHGYRLLGPVT